MINRRQLFKGLAGVGAAALILPPTLAENVEAAEQWIESGRFDASIDPFRKYWALDQTMLAPGGRTYTFSGYFDPNLLWYVQQMDRDGHYTKSSRMLIPNVPYTLHPETTALRVVTVPPVEKVGSYTVRAQLEFFPTSNDIRPLVLPVSRYAKWS